MPSSSFQLTDLNGDTSSESQGSKKGHSRRQPGCYVSNLVGFVLLLLAIVIAVGIAIVVYFATSKDLTCHFHPEDGLPTIPEGESDAIQACNEWIQGSGTAAVAICSTCPASAATTTTTISSTSTTATSITTTTSMVTTTASPQYPRDRYRLPSSIKPSHYQLRLQPNIYGTNPSEFNFEGSVIIDVSCIEATSTITLHVDRLTIDRNDVSVAEKTSGNPVAIRDITYEQAPHFYHIHLQQALTAGTEYQIQFKKFTGPLSTDGQGLYLSSYRDGDQTVYLATTQMEAPYARKAFPCFDEPAMKATFDTILVRLSTTNRNYITLSNMNLLKSEPQPGGWVDDHYNRTMVMSTYLLAFIVCDYVSLDQQHLGIRYSTWARPNAIQYADRAQEHGLKLFEYFETRFRPLYSGVINKLDNIAIPDFNAGAMENWGLITYREALLYKPGVASASDEDWIAEVIGHEIAHMWFGNMVSPKWWSWLWLNEAFASFWDFHSVGEIYTHWRTTDVTIAGSLHSVMISDALASSHPMTADVETRQEVSSIFDSVTYTKGAFVVRMMNFIMGQDNFIDALNTYLQNNAYGNAEHKDLWAALDQKGPENMTLRMDPWVTQMGYPVVTVTKMGNGDLHLTQKRFLVGSENVTDDRYKDPPYEGFDKYVGSYQWEIPITVTFSNNVNFNQNGSDITWLEKGKALHLTNPSAGETNGWYIINVQQFGYYRVNYDLANWQALITQLKNNHEVIHPINRAQIINDAWNLVKTDMLDMSIALSVLDYLSKETDYVPWRAFAREMDYVKLMLDRSVLYANLELFIRETVSRPLEELGLTIGEDEAPVDIYAKVLVADYACSFGHSTCISLALQQFTEWKNTGTNGINPNLRSRFYCTAVENGDLSDWNFVYEQYKAQDDATERSRLRTALTCSKEPSLLTRLLEMTMDVNEIRTQDVRATIQSVAGNRWGRDIAFHFVIEHFSSLAGMMSASNMNNLIAAMTSHFNTPYHLSLLQLLENNEGSTTFTPAINQARAQTQANIEWLQKYLPALEDWLKPEERPSGRLNYRLPEGFKPSHYEVRLKPHIYGNDSSKFYFEGSCTITVMCDKATKVITLHMDRLEIDDRNISVKQENSQKELFQYTSYEELRHFYELHLSESLEEGKIYLLEFSHFTGSLTTDGNGFYLSYYRDGQENIYLATTQMEPPYARKTFPCFDEPAMKATFDITLVRRTDTGRNYISLANTALVNTDIITGTDGHQWALDRFNITPTMPTYLLAFIVCDYLYLENITTSSPSIQYRTYARPNAIQWAQRAQEYGLKLYDWLDRRFQPAYGSVMRKMDNIAIPDFNFGAMENWGLITYREGILYQPGVTSASNEYWMATVITHEIAHMWFGDYVSPKWWNWLWLNEAFASWWDVYTTNEVFPGWKVVDEWVSSSVYSVLSSDALATSHPMTADVQSPAEINAIFDGVTYNKGAAAIRMMQFIMGLDKFVEGLNLYLRFNQLKNADTEALWRALDVMMSEQGFGSSYMTEKMDPWVTQMGFPVVQVSRTAEGFRLTQKRFLIGSVEDTDDRYKNATYNYQWEIPITFATSQDTNMDKTRADIRWLSKNMDLTIPDSTVNDTDAWILINIQQVGYFRVLYDYDTWRALIGQLNRDHSVFPAINRGQIINDAWNLAKAGLLNLSVALETLDFLQSETELAPWRAFALEMDYVERMLERTVLFPELQKFMQETVSGPLSRLTLNIPDNMVPVDVFVRTLIADYACSYGLIGCVNEAKRMFTEWKNTGINGINPNLRRRFYCTAVAQGDSGDWEFVYQHYKSSDDTTELTSLRHALSCSKDLMLLRRLLNMALDPAEVRTQDVATTIQWVAANPLGRDLAFQFYVDNFEAIKGLLDVLYLGRTLLSVSSHFNTDFNLQQLQQFAAVSSTSVIRSVLDQAIAQTRTNMGWLKNNYDTISNWLTNRGPTTTPPPPAGSYRLPSSLKPYFYDLRLQPHIYDSSNLYFEGSVTIHITCESSTNVIVLHQDRLQINSSAITVEELSGTSPPIPITDITEDVTYHFYNIHLDQNLQPGRNYSVKFPYFRGVLRSNGQGLYLSSYTEEGITVRLATTQMEPTYARQALPCFDEPALKAKFRTKLVRRTDTGRDYISLSNMPNVSSTVIDNSWTEDEFEESMLMSTYLLAFIVCDYKYLSTILTEFGVDSRTYARPSRISEAQVSHEYSVELFRWFNQRFEPPYQRYLSKVDHIAIQNFNAGAMENWGLITYRETLLYNAMSTASDRSWGATVTSHELAHMWFGNKVSPKWWDWLWLNEAFASYWETYAVEALHPDWKSWSEVDITSSVFSAMQIDCYTTSHPLSNPVETPSQINAQFDTITYTKGSAIIGMMHMVMGSHFIPALNVYLTKNSLGSAEHKDLLDALDEYSRNNLLGLNLTDILEPWITQMGYPVVNIQRGDNNQLILTQERFLLPSTASSPDSGTFGYRYVVPISYTTSTKRNFNQSHEDVEYLPKQGSYNINLDPDDEWVVVNLLHKGYYRVNYDVDTWRALIKQLNTDHKAIHEVNRATILDDAWNLVKADKLELSIALQTLDYMRKETDYGPWRVFARETDYMERMIERTELFASFQRFMQDVVDEPLTKLGFDLPADNLPPVDVFLRTWLISDACHYDHVACVTKAKNSVSDWMNGLGNNINVNIRSHMYCTAVREGGHDVWEFIYRAYQNEENSSEKTRLRSALGCSKDPTILMTFLDMCLYDDEVPRSETSSCVSAVAANRYGRDVALNFVMENFPMLLRSFSSGTVGSMVSTVTNHFHSNFHLAQLQFLRNNYDVSGITNTLNTVQERTVTNMRWLDKNFDTIKQWLASKATTSTETINYRLPTAIVPYHYDLELYPDIYHENPKDFSFNGTVKIWIKCVTNTTNITLHAYRLNVQQIQESTVLLFEDESDTGYVAEVTYDEPRHFVIVHLNRELSEGQTFVLKMTFSASMPSDGVGLYYSSYLDGNQTVYLATTKFEAPYARRAFPCFDEPALKAKFDITLIRRQTYNGRTYNSKSSNELMSSTNLSNGLVADRFYTTLQSPTYLLAFIVSDFLCLENVTNTGVKYRTCARPNAYLLGQLAQDYGVIEFEWLEAKFEPPYNKSKLENMAIPDFLSGAMENWGLITYRETLLYEEGVTTASDMDWILEVVAHELAHMWFGNIVSPRWWNWLWLNEAFASFWDFHLVEIIKPDWRMTEQFIVQSLHSTMATDSLQSSHPLTADVESPSEIQAIFDSITYTKGAAIVRMMHFMMGEENFIEALNVYLDNRQYDVADHQDLWDALDEYSANNQLNLNMTDLMDPWVTQMNYPVVEVEWNAAGVITLTQKRFLSSGESTDDSALYGYKWDIPITLATITNPDFRVNQSNIRWFSKHQSQVSITLDTNLQPTVTNWVLLNVQQFGYYRVNYDERNWRALIAQLNSNSAVFHPINRAQIINDAWSLAKAGQLDMSIALSTLDFLRSDSDYVPWRAITGELTYLDLMLSLTSVYGKFEQYMVSLVNSTFYQLGMANHPDEPPIQIFQRDRIVNYACRYGLQDCRKNATEQFAEWRADPENNRIDVNLRSVIYCNAIRSGTTEDWEFALSRYSLTDSSSEKSNLRAALACTPQPWLLKRYMDLTVVTSVIRSQDVRSVLEAVSSNPVGRDMAWNFLKQYFDVLPNHMTPGNFGGMVQTLTRYFSEEYQLDEVRRFMAETDISIARSAFQQVLEQTSLNIAWKEKYLPVITEFLDNQN